MRTKCEQRRHARERERERIRARAAAAQWRAKTSARFLHASASGVPSARAHTPSFPLLNRNERARAADDGGHSNRSAFIAALALARALEDERAALATGGGATTIVVREYLAFQLPRRDDPKRARGGAWRSRIVAFCAPIDVENFASSHNLQNTSPPLILSANVAAVCRRTAAAAAH